MKKLTAEWVRKAEEDYQVAVQTHRGPNRFHNTVCFHCQQAAEKYLKAILEENGLKIPKIHDLDKLCKMLLPSYQSLGPLRRGLIFLKRFAVEIRYVGENATKRDAVAALRWTGKVRSEARGLLGLPSLEE
jgi:HEPN domain-containing protein